MPFPIRDFRKVEKIHRRHSFFSDINVAKVFNERLCLFQFEILEKGRKYIGDTHFFQKHWCFFTKHGTWHPGGWVYTFVDMKDDTLFLGEIIGIHIPSSPDLQGLYWLNLALRDLKKGNSYLLEEIAMPYLRGYSIMVKYRKYIEDILKSSAEPLDEFERNWVHRSLGIQVC